jgi:hypothetical protein
MLKCFLYQKKSGEISPWKVTPYKSLQAMHEPCTSHAPAMLARSHTANAPHPPETYPSPSSSFPEARNVTEYTDRMSKILLSL